MRGRGFKAIAASISGAGSLRIGKGGDAENRLPALGNAFGRELSCVGKARLDDASAQGFDNAARLLDRLEFTPRRARRSACVRFST